ncbi:GNAT family N-acetyltransferase [Hyunsoonleella ulvae]|uniref:GNAT family N-acetyltransferase n=2 Tax=Flavobacteriaceae TaxID=49546 RepID=UPI001939B659|nr:GNAT family N-acetyltransferase [Hyunsoonleella ulvae]
MEIKHEKLDKKGRFFIEIENLKVAEMTYTYAGNEKIIIDHTEVKESLKGQGIGYKLVEAAVSYAREQNIKILPLCPFANAVFKKRKEYSDVLF